MVYTDENINKEFISLYNYVEQLNYFTHNKLLTGKTFHIFSIIGTYFTNKLKNIISSPTKVSRIKLIIAPKDYSLTRKKLEYELYGKIGQEISFKKQYDSMGYNAGMMFDFKHRNLVNSLYIKRKLMMKLRGIM